MPRSPIRTRGSSEAWLSLGSFLGVAQGSAIRAKDSARLSLLTLGPWKTLLAFGTQVTLRPSRSREACVPRLALRSWRGHNCSVFIRHIEHGPWRSWGAREAWQTHSIFSWAPLFSLAPFFSFWPRGPSCTGSSGKARHALDSFCSDFSLGSRWPCHSRIPLESWQPRRSLQPFGASGC